LVAIVASASTSGERIKAFGRNASSWTLGNLIGPVIGGIVLVKSDFFILFLSSTAIGVTSFFISIYGLKGFEVCLKKKMLKRDSYSLTIRSRIAIFLITLANYSTMGVMFYLFPAFLSDSGMTSFQVGLLFAILGLARMSGSMASDNISRFGIKRSMGLGFLVMTATLAYIPSFFSLEGFALAMILTGFAFGILSPQIYSIVSEMYPDESIGSAIGYVETFFGIGFTFGPFIGGLAAETLGISSPYFIVSIISGLALIPIILLEK